MKTIIMLAMKRRLPHLAIFASLAIAYMIGLLAPIDRFVADLGFHAGDRPASGAVVIVEIDARSIRELDVWPWPRGHHADLLDRLIAAGARRVAFDVDFSSRSSAQSDRRLAAALERAGGKVVLPILKQVARDDRGIESIAVSLPIAEFRPHVEPAHVNVKVDSDNLVRSYLARERFGQIDVPGLAAVLAVDAGSRAPPVVFNIDFGIAPASIPRLSYVDVLTGRFDPRAIAGKTVIVGATAVELGDRLPVPIHGVIAGPVVQALAFETIVQGRIVAPLARWPVLLATLLLAVLVSPRLTGWTWRQGLVASLACGAALVALSLVAGIVWLIAIDVAAAVLMIAGSYGYGVVGRIDLQAASIYRERMLSLHRRAMMSTVVESSFDGIVITAEDGLVQLSNAAANEMMGWDDVAIIGRQIDDFIPRPALAADAGDDDDLLVRPREVEAIRDDGTTFTMELVVNTSRMSMSSGSSGGGKAERTDEIVKIFTFRDVTERRRVEEARQRAMEEAVAANRAKTEFLANMSHELRTPLNAIIGFSDIMRSEALGPLGVPDYADFVRDINDGGHRLLEVVDDVLDMSRIEAGDMAVEETEFAVDGLVEHAVRGIREQARKARLALATDFAANLPHVIADERMVKQILRNLLSNAVKFTPAGGSVSVRTRRRADGGVTIEVADTGRGIPADAIERVLEPFAQADSRLQRDAEGTGLGLPLVKSMTELHGGRLVIDSAVDRGTTVAIEFPADRSRGRASGTLEAAPVPNAA